MATPARAASPTQRSFSDWSVTCDNGLRCAALGGQDDSGRLLMIERDAGPDAGVSIELIGEHVDLLDGDPLTYPKPAWRHEDEDGFHARSTRDLTAVQRYIDAIRNGTRLHAKTDEAGTGLSLRGLSAALLYIDEVQGRLGTRGALLRRGGKPESSVPAAPRLPLLQAAPSPKALGEADAARLVADVRRMQAATLAQAECDQQPGAGSDQAWPLTDTDALVHLGCWMGAYQGSGLLFRVPRAQPAKATRLLLPPVPGDPPQDMLTSADYDPATGQLHHYAKGRGLGDCGETASWVFDGHGFVLAQWAAMTRCAGVHGDHWPTRWRSRTAAGSAR